jgi:hypothetical protein
MADDHTQRPYRSNAPAGTAAGTPSGNDPLAELARLIGQNDPFSEFGRAAAQRAPAAAPDPVPDWPPRHQSAPPEAAAPPLAAAPPSPQLFGAPAFGRQPYGGDLYQVESENPGYGAPAEGVPGYQPLPAGAEFEHDGYQGTGHGEYAAPGNEQDEFYDDVPPSGRRIGIIAIAGIFALAVIGTAGAFGYRAIFGSSSMSGPPPVIKADTAPSKIVPAATGKDAQANKLIADRVSDHGQGEKLVSREEQPVANPANGVFPPVQGNANPSPIPQLGSGIVGAEPKRIRTIAIHPDGGALAAPAAPEPAAQERPQEPPPQPKAVTAPVRPPPPARRASAEEAPPPRAAATRVAAQPAANAPLSLNPNAEPAPRPERAAPVQRTAAVAPPTRLAAAPASGGGGYAVQVSAQRSEADAQAAFRSLQGKYPGQLGGRQPLIKRVDLGAKGIYFRAMVGPFGNSSEASDLCAKLKSAGGSCLVQRN